MGDGEKWVLLSRPLHAIHLGESAPLGNRLPKPET
jgi:hypothetical protein